MKITAWGWFWIGLFTLLVLGLLARTLLATQLIRQRRNNPDTQ